MLKKPPISRIEILVNIRNQRQTILFGELYLRTVTASDEE
jgi:hypothetical protein